MIVNSKNYKEELFNTEKQKFENNDNENNSSNSEVEEVDKKLEMIKKISSLSLPSVISSLIVYSLETINLIFCSKIDGASEYSKNDILNSIGLGNIFMNFGGCLFGFGMITCLETLCSQSFGRNNLKELSKWVKICNYVMTTYFLIICVLFIFSKDLIILLGQPEIIAEIANKYIYSLIPSIIIQFYMYSYTKLLNAQQIFNPVLCINLICVFLHPLWCYIFYDILNLGVAGLGCAYNTTNFLMLVLIYIYVQFYKLEKKVDFKDIKFVEIKYFLKMSFQCGVLSSIDTLGFEILSFIASYLPQDELDAHICVVNIYTNIYAISIGFATAITTLVGNFMGENKPKNAIKYTKLALLLNFALSVAISLTFIFFHGYIALIYVDDAKIIRISSRLIRIVGIFVIFDSIQLQLCGVIRGIGKQFVGMIVAVIVFIFIQTAICCVFVFLLNFGVYGIWFSQIISGIMAVSVYFIILKYSDWEDMAKEASNLNESINLENEGENDILDNEQNNPDNNKKEEKSNIFSILSDNKIQVNTSDFSILTRK